MLKKHFFIWKSLPLYQRRVLNARRTNIRGKNYSGNKLCIGIYLNSCFLSIPYILDIYTNRHNGIDYISIPFMVLSQKSLDCAHRINQTAELKKKKRTRKDTENVEVLGMSMEMTLSITNKLVENLFHENKCFFHMFSRVWIVKNFSCSKANQLFPRVSREIN